MWVWRKARDLKMLYQLSGERRENQVVATKANALDVWLDAPGFILLDTKQMTVIIAKTIIMTKYGT